MIDYGKDVEILWKDKLRHYGLPLSFTTYAIIRKPNQWTNLVIEEGLLATKLEEIHCYRIDDISLFQSSVAKIYGVGNITVYCNDASCKQVVLRNVKNPFKVRALLNDIVEEEKRKRKMSYIETPHKN